MQRVLAVSQDAIDLATSLSGESFERFDAAPDGPGVPLVKEVPGIARIAVAAFDRELIHRQGVQLGQVRLAQRAFKPSLVDRLHSIPAQAVELRHGLDRQHFAEPRYAPGQTPRDPRVLRQPRQMLQLRAASRTRHAESRNEQVRFRVQNGQVPDPAFVPVVIPFAGLPAPGTDHRHVRPPDQFDANVPRPTALIRLMPLNKPDAIPFPFAQQGGNVIAWQRILLSRKL